MPNGFTSYWSHTHKTAKAPPGWLNVVLLMSPSKSVPLKVLCPNAGLCAGVCLRFAGRNPMALPAQQARAAGWKENRIGFLMAAEAELGKIIAREARKGRQVCARFDGLSDTGDGGYLAARFPEAKFVDYTKDKSRYLRWLKQEGGRTNWHLTFSRDSEKDDEFCQQVLEAGGTVAVVFPPKELPAEWNGFKVIDGDTHDLRFMDPPGVVVGLRAKGSMGRATSKVKKGFFNWIPTAKPLLTRKAK